MRHSILSMVMTTDGSGIMKFKKVSLGSIGIDFGGDLQLIPKLGYAKVGGIHVFRIGWIYFGLFLTLEF